MKRRRDRSAVAQAWWAFILMLWVMFAVSVIFICLLFGGCCNVYMRSEARTSPYWVADRPYYCTAEVWDCCVCAPIHKWKNRGGAYGQVWYTFATLTWPFWAVDEVCEVVGDTLFLPVDGAYAVWGGKKERESETICIEEKIMQEQEKRK